MLQLHPLPADCAVRQSTSACDSCGARGFSVCGGLERQDLLRLDALAERMTLHPGEALTRQGDPADHLFNITSGSVRVFSLMPDGRRQITGFLFAGDFLGLAAEGEYAFSAEAIEPVAVCRFRAREYRALMRQTPDLEAALFQRTTHELAAARAQLMVLGRKTALERMASFLLDLPTHDPARPTPDGHVRLPMTRTEIADYLGLTIETVSRALTRLKTAGVIRLLSLTEARIEQPDRLRAIAQGET